MRSISPAAFVVALTVGLIAVVAFIDGAPARRSYRYRKTTTPAITGQESQLRKLTHRLNHVNHGVVEFERKLDSRVDPERIQKAKSLRSRIETLEEPKCERNSYHCGGHDTQCVANLFVCDGHKDCRNGEDENHCEIPFEAGDVFVGDKVFDTCGKLNPDHITVIIKDIIPPNPPGSGLTQLKVLVKIQTENRRRIIDLSAPYTGFYIFSKHQLFIQSTQKDHLGLIGQFDGHDFDRFVGESVYEGSQNVCAKFIYKRQ